MWRQIRDTDSVELLGHHLANARQGALLGFGINANVSLLAKLYRKMKEPHKPWFRHAAYRAIDQILRF